MDFSNNPLFDVLNCSLNPNLTSIKINNNKQHIAANTIYNSCWYDLPNLTTICADEFEVIPMQNYIANCGLITQSINFVTDCDLGINEIENNNDFVIYPNPSSDGLFTVLFDEKITNGTVEVYNLLGQKIASDDLQNTTEHLLDLSKVATGNYYLRIQDDSQQFFIKRIIIK